MTAETIGPDGAEAEAASEDYEAWVAAGRRGVVSHEDAMAFLRGGEAAARS